MNTELFELFVKHTDEKKVLLKKIIEIVRPNKSMTFLDCGCGTGDITMPLSKLVKKAVAVDVDNALLKKISKNDNIKFIRAKMEDLNLKEKFDFAIMSHVWYYLKFENLGSIINKILNYLKDNGKLILVSGEGECKVFEIFGPKIGFKPFGETKKLIRVLNNLNLKFKDYKVRTKLVADSLDQIFRVYSYFFEDKRDEYLKLEKEIKEYLKKFKENNKFVTHGTEHVLVINKI